MATRGAPLRARLAPGGQRRRPPPLIASRLRQSPPVGRQPAPGLDLDLAGRPQLGAQRPGMGTRHVAGQAQHPPAVTRIRGRRRRWRQVGGHVGCHVIGVTSGEDAPRDRLGVPVPATHQKAVRASGKAARMNP